MHCSDLGNTSIPHCQATGQIIHIPLLHRGVFKNNFFAGRGYYKQKPHLTLKNLRAGLPNDGFLVAQEKNRNKQNQTGSNRQRAITLGADSSKDGPYKFCQFPTQSDGCESSESISVVMVLSLLILSSISHPSGKSLQG